MYDQLQVAKKTILPSEMRSRIGTSRALKRPGRLLSERILTVSSPPTKHMSVKTSNQSLVTIEAGPTMALKRSSLVGHTASRITEVGIQTGNASGESSPPTAELPTNTVSATQ